MRYVELVEDTKAQVLDQLVDRLRPVIKARARGHDAGTGVGEFQQVLEMDGVIWRFARDEDELAAFFQADVGGTVDEVCPGAGCDRTERAHRARDDDHPGLFNRAGRRFCRQIVEPPVADELRIRGQSEPFVKLCGVRLFEIYAHFDLRDGRGGRRHYEIYGLDHTARSQQLQRPVSVYRARGTRYGYCQFHKRINIVTSAR